jgi:hypothetical protein
MPRKVLYLMLLFALLVPPAWAQGESPNNAPVVAPETEAGLEIFMPDPQPRSCLSDCYNNYVGPTCGQPASRLCANEVIAFCRCQCNPDAC